jgi:uncharacterized protein Usg
VEDCLKGSKHTMRDISEMELMLNGYGLTTAQFLYHLPDHPHLLQSYVWQDYDLFPEFPSLKRFLAFWEAKLEGPLFKVTVAHQKLIKPADFRAFRETGASWKLLTIDTPQPGTFKPGDGQ